MRKQIEAQVYIYIYHKEELPILQVFRQDLPKDVIPRSVLKITFEGQMDCLLCTLADGSLFYFAIEANGQLGRQKRVTLGTQPTTLRKFRFVAGEHILWFFSESILDIKRKTYFPMTFKKSSVNIYCWFFHRKRCMFSGVTWVCYYFHWFWLHVTNCSSIYLLPFYLQISKNVECFCLFRQTNGDLFVELETRFQ